MSTISYWIQRADYSATDYDPVDVSAAIQVTRSHDWTAELQFQRELETARRETCPPGIGFVADDGRILHICPGQDGAALVFYHFDEPRVRFRMAPTLISFALAIASWIIAWQLLTSSDTLTSKLVASAAMAVGLYGMLRIGRPRKRDMRVHTQPVGRTSNNVLAGDVPEFIRRFYAGDHVWLMERTTA